MDVRDAPISLKPVFSKWTLGEALEAAGIAYEHVRALGNPKPGRDAARAGKTAEFRRIYKTRLATPDGHAALVEILRRAEGERICLMCYERSAASCHRSLVTAELSLMAPLEVENLLAQDHSVPTLFPLC